RRAPVVVVDPCDSAAEGSEFEDVVRHPRGVRGAVVDEPAFEAPPDDSPNLAEPHLPARSGKKAFDQGRAVDADAVVRVERPDLRSGMRPFKKGADPSHD